MEEMFTDPMSGFALSVFAAHDALMRSGERVTRPLGQSSARWQVLGRAGYRPQTVAQMAKEMGHARQSVQRLADALTAEGLLVARDNPADRRARLLELTPQGATVLREISARDEEWSRELLGRLGAARLTAAAEALDAITRIFDDYLTERKN